MQKKCLVCGNAFDKKYSESKKYFERKKYCSQACSLKNTTISSQKNHFSLPKGSIPWNKDLKYTEEMRKTLDLSGLEKGRGLFKGLKRPQFSGRSSPRWKEPTTLNCEYCGKTVERKPWQIKKHTYCNLVCSRAGIRGRASPVFKGENAKNPLRQRIMQLPEYAAWRQAVFSRDSFKCVWCGAKSNFEADHIKPYKVIRDEHGIKTTEDARVCKELWDVANGRTLCRECHRKTDNYPRNLKSKPT